jgi:hypothetical protein
VHVSFLPAGKAGDTFLEFTPHLPAPASGRFLFLARPQINSIPSPTLNKLRLSAFGVVKNFVSTSNKFRIKNLLNEVLTVKAV